MMHPCPVDFPLPQGHKQALSFQHEAPGSAYGVRSTYSVCLEVKVGSSLEQRGKGSWRARVSLAWRFLPKCFNYWGVREVGGSKWNQKKKLDLKRVVLFIAR